MEDKALQAKQAKAERYAQEPDRFTLVSIAVRMDSEHGTRLITYRGGAWECSCELFQPNISCSHVIKVKKLYGIGG